MRLPIHPRARVAGDTELEHTIDRGFVPVPNCARNAALLYDTLARKQINRDDQEVPGKGGGMGIIDGHSS